MPLMRASGVGWFPVSFLMERQWPKWVNSNPLSTGVSFPGGERDQGQRPLAPSVRRVPVYAASGALQSCLIPHMSGCLLVGRRGDST
jgi:hypothetical protein